MSSKLVCVSYMRFSSKGQKSGNSEQRQEEGFDDFVAVSKLPVAHQYWDRGESAFHGRHRDGDFGQLLADCAAKIYPAGSTVWFEDMDRFSRQELADVLADWRTITRAGYCIRVGSLGETYDQHTDQMRLIGVIMKAILAHEESQKKSKRQTSNIKAKREAGAAAVNTKHSPGSKSRACPSWLSVDGARYVPNDFAQVIKEMFRLALEGNGAKTIHGMLKLGKVDVLGYLRDRAVIGEYRPMKRIGKSERVPHPDFPPIPNYYPAIIDEDTFFRVQTALDGRRKQRGRKGKFVTNLFKELIYGDDGVKMFIKVESRGRRMLTRRTPGKMRSWDYNAIEAGILLELRDVSLQPATATAKDYDGILADLKKRIDTLTEFQAELPSRANLVALSKLEAKVDEVTAEHEAEKGKVAPPVALMEAQTLLGQLDGLAGDDLLLARTRIAACMARLLKRINVTIRESIHGTPECVVWLAFVDGSVRVFSVENVGRKAAKYVYTGLCGADGMPGQDCQATATVGDKTVTVDFDWAETEAEKIVAYAMS